MKLKKSLSLLFLLALMLALSCISLPALADELWEDGATPSSTEIYYTASAQVIPYISDTTTYSYNETESQFSDGKGIIVFDNEITAIPDSCFRNSEGYCTSASTLTGIILPSSVTSVGEWSFYGCFDLSSVSMPAVKSIGAYAFDATYLVDVSLPAATSIGAYAFYDCPKLESVSMPVATSIAEYAFSNSCAETSSTSKLASVSAPNVTTVGIRAFYNCGALSSISMPKVTTINSFAFYNCTKLASISIPNVTSIGKEAFSACSSLTDISLPKVTEIGYNAFSACIKLTTA